METNKEPKKKKQHSNIKQRERERERFNDFQIKSKRMEKKLEEISDYYREHHQCIE